jgi:para-nitrobenzyl esterase
MACTVPGFTKTCGVAIVLLSMWVAAIPDAAMQPTVKIRSGTVVGQYVGTSGTVAAFLGIPYAQPPLGRLRFAPPERLASLPVEPFPATDNTITCEQREDCLILNVWMPKDSGGVRRPVMVWLHGGGNTAGSSNRYVGTQIVEQSGVVLVTVNYRLGAFGFLALPGLDDENPRRVSGNQALLDQQLALGWVRENIAAFGGDPTNVTLFGESAGATDAAAQLVSPGAAGLFRQAILESLVNATQPLAPAESSGINAARLLGCDSAVLTAAQVVACLRALPRLAVSFITSQIASLPTVDGVVMPVSIAGGFGSGSFSRVSIVIGANQTEGTAFQNVTRTEAQYTMFLNGIFGPGSPLVPYVQTTLYPSANYPTPDFPGGSPSQAAAIVYGDSTLDCTAENARALLARWVPVYGYEFNQPDPVLFARSTAAPGIVWNDAHFAEVSYVFGLDSILRPLTGLGTAGLNSGSPSLWGNGSRADQTLSNTMIRYWTNVAAVGRPNTPARQTIPYWPAYTSRSPAVQSLITATVNGILHSIGPVTDYAVKHKCDFWNNRTVGAGSPGNHLIAPSGPN